MVAVTLKALASLSGDGQKDPDQLIGLVENSLEESYPHKFSRILVVGREGGGARHEQFLQHLDSRGTVREKVGHTLHQQVLLVNAVELSQGVVGVDQKDLIQVTIQDRVRLFRVGPDQRLQRNQMPQADKGLSEKKILLLAVHSILSLDIPVLLDQSGCGASNQ